MANASLATREPSRFAATSDDGGTRHIIFRLEIAAAFNPASTTERAPICSSQEEQANVNGSLYDGRGAVKK